MDGEGWNPLFTRHFNEWEVEEAQRLLSHLGLEAMIFFFFLGGGGGWCWKISKLVWTETKEVDVQGFTV